VLLAGDDAAPDSPVAKVADFGLARDFGAASRVQAAKYGTITHMPPELLAEGSLTKVGRSSPMSGQMLARSANCATLKACFPILLRSKPLCRQCASFFL